MKRLAINACALCLVLGLGTGCGDKTPTGDGGAPMGDAAPGVPDGGVSLAEALLGADLIPYGSQLEADLFPPEGNALPADLLPPQ